MIRIGILTSSRADYGIYLPLLKRFLEDNEISFELIVFGTHLSKFHGYTINNIIADGFKVSKTIDSLLISDSPNSIASSYSLTALKFSDFWSHYQKEFDLIFALGDRFEMAAAVAASIPFGIKIAHLHGGETTLGAIDNIYRHSITLASSIHFVSAEPFVNRIIEIKGDSKNIYNIGSISLENLNNLKLLTTQEFYEKWNINLDIPTILITVHPETVEYKFNTQNSKEIATAIIELALKYQVLITMPNADTSGSIFRDKFKEIAKNNNKIKLVENLGTQSYFSAMHFCKLLIGNTSSGIIEAASFGKFVLNIGERQMGRLASKNVVNIPFDSKSILEVVELYFDKFFKGENIYFKDQPSKRILEVIKKWYGSF